MPLAAIAGNPCAGGVGWADGGDGGASPAEAVALAFVMRQG